MSLSPPIERNVDTENESAEINVAQLAWIGVGCIIFGTIFVIALVYLYIYIKRLKIETKSKYFYSQNFCLFCNNKKT